MTRSEIEYGMVVVKKFAGFNFRRYGNPWVALVRPDRSKCSGYSYAFDVGGYTGGYNRGEAGELYVTTPIEGQIYAYGQKDYRKPHESLRQFIQFINGEFVPIETTDIIRALRGA